MSVRASKLLFSDEERSEQENAAAAAAQKAHQLQKRRIQRQYAAANRKLQSRMAEKARIAAANAGRFLRRHKKGALLAAVVALLALWLLNTAASCSVLVQGALSAIGSTTYPSEDDDMLAAEEQYCALEAELQEKLDDYERTHAYDEYHYELDEIKHDPYVLISAVTALCGGEWAIDEVGDILQTLFDQQYLLTETVTEETRYRIETRTGRRLVRDPVTGAVTVEWHEYEVQVPYIYRICTVQLENFDLSHVPAYLMSENQLSMYAAYMATLGNRPDLFAGSAYVDAYYNTEYEKYEIPPEALEDAQFAAMIEEAEKYLGYPYVWGGSNPETSFDCSGFVAWVVNNCGNGWSVGRPSAEGLRQLCTRVAAADAKPGDLIFFENTYDTPGASHVGIYVGENTMIHCGNPIQYARIDTNYWQTHFLAFGRLLG